MRLVLAIIFSACAISAQAQDLVTLGKSENTAVLDTTTANSCAPTLLEHFSRQSIYQISSYPPERYSLITQEFDIGRGCFEGFSPSKMEVSSRPLDVKSGHVEEKKLWSFTTDGVYGQVEDGTLWGLYRVDMPGCCGAANTSKYFSLETGKLLGSATGRLLEISFPDSYDPKGVVESRFISVEDSTASSPQTSKKAMATIFYADRQTIKETIFVSGEGKLGNEDWWLSELSFIGQDLSNENLILSGLNESKIHITLKCRCDDAQTLDIIVPVSINGVDEKSAIVTGPKGVSLTKSTYNPAIKPDVPTAEHSSLAPN